MPIRNLSDRTGALPTIGELRKGEPKGERSPGRDLNEFFRFTSDAPLVEAAFVKLFGDRPRSIPCLLPGNTTDEVFDAWQEEYNASTLLHRCDGENVVNQLQPDGTRKLYPLGEGPPCPYLTAKPADRGCKPSGRLKIIPVVQDDRAGTMRVADLRRIGQVLVLTTSKHDIKNIAECLHWYEQIHGTLAGIPFVLSRTPVEISTPRGEGKRARVKKWLIDLTPAPEWVTLKLESQRQRAFAATPGAIAALPAAAEVQPVAVEPRPYPAIEADEEEAEPGDRYVDPDTGEITDAADEPEEELDELDHTLEEHAARTNGKPAWSDTPLGRHISALVDALEHANKKYTLPDDDADEATLKGWISSKKATLAEPVGAK